MIGQGMGGEWGINTRQRRTGVEGGGVEKKRTGREGKIKKNG